MVCQIKVVNLARDGNTQISVSYKACDRVFEAPETGDDRLDRMRLGMHDKTNLENPDFRFVL